MPDIIHFVVDAVPVAQPRQRHAVSKKGTVVNYTPKSHPVTAFKKKVAYGAKAVYSGPILEGPLRVSFTAYFPRPKNMVWKTKPMYQYFHTGKPDIDNIQKSIFDSLNDILWKDDSQIVDLHGVKYVCDGKQSPYVDIYVNILN